MLIYLQLPGHIQGKPYLRHGDSQLNEHQDVEDKLNTIFPHPLNPPLAQCSDNPPLAIVYFFSEWGHFYYKGISTKFGSVLKHYED